MITGDHPAGTAMRTLFSLALILSDLTVLDARFNDRHGGYTTTQKIPASSYGQIDLSFDVVAVVVASTSSP